MWLRRRQHPHRLNDPHLSTQNPPLKGQIGPKLGPKEPNWTNKQFLVVSAQRGARPIPEMSHCRAVRSVTTTFDSIQCTHENGRLRARPPSVHRPNLLNCQIYKKYRLNSKIKLMMMMLSLYLILC